MENLIELLFSFAGLILYWILSSRKNMKKGNAPKEVSVPEQVIPPKKDGADMEVPAPEGTFFEEIIKEFSDPESRKKAVERKQEGPIIDKEAATEKAKEQLSEEMLDPKVLEERLYREQMDEYWDDYKPYESDLLPADKEKVAHFQKLRTKKNRKYAKWFSDPQSVRQAFIMKEIMDKKLWDE